MSAPDPRHVAAPAEAILDEVERAVVGKREVVELVLLALLADGHVLLGGRARRGQDADGALVRGRDRPELRARAVHAGPDARRRHRLVDLRPARGELRFHPGPIFANLLLGDEINRAPPKTQAALLEAMEERQVTADDGTHAARAAVPGARHAEPDRVRGHLPAARGAARPLPRAHARRLPGCRGRVADARRPRSPRRRRRRARTDRVAAGC